MKIHKSQIDKTMYMLSTKYHEASIFL